MIYYNQINKHIKNKFSSSDKIKYIKKIPTNSELEKMNDNILYKIPLISVAVDVVNFKNMNKNTDPIIMASIMSEFTYGVTKIMKEFDGQSIDIQGDGIYCVLNGSLKEDMDNAFSLSCALNVFKKHINKMIDKYFENKLKSNNVDFFFSVLSSNDTKFNFGIGLWFSFDNYISKVGHRKDRELIFLGEAVNNANALAKESSRNHKKDILMNDLLKTNFTDKQKKELEKIGGFIKYNLNFNEYVWGCSWILTNYDNFVENNT